MARPPKKAPTVDETPNVRLNATTGRYHWEIERTLGDGGKFRRAGSSKTLDGAISKRDVAIAAFEANRSGSDIEANGRLSVEEFAEQCVKTIWPEEIDERTVIGYSDILRLHVVPRVGTIKLAKLSYDHIANINAALKAEGKAVQTRRNVRNCISKLLSTGQRLGKVKQGYNPAKLLMIKAETRRDELGNKVTHKRTLTPTEINALLEQAKGTHYEGVVYLGLYAGLRIGEIVGLTWANVQLDKGMLRITQQRQRVRGKGIKVKDPKTGAGSRTIPISFPLRDWLKKADKRGRYVITNESGSGADANVITDLFKELVTLAGLCDIQDANGAKLPDPTPHDLRHTFCYFMANGWAIELDEKGRILERTPSVGLTTLAKIAGHSSPTVTIQYYIDSSTDDMITAMSHVR